MKALWVCFASSSHPLFLLVMGYKKVINKTNAALNVLLTVRKGDNPGTQVGTMAFLVAAGATQTCTYSGNENPYLDATFVSAPIDGGLLSTQQTVITRGGLVDNALNQNNTLTVTKTGEDLVAAFSNS